MRTTDPGDAARIELLLTELRLPAVKLVWASLAAQADKEGWPAGRFLAALAEHEIAERGRRPLGLEEMVASRPPGGGSRPVPIGSRPIGVSLQPAIPRRVAPQRSPLPLHQSPTTVAQSRSREAIKCVAQPHCKHAVKRLPVMPCRAGHVRRQQGVISTSHAGWHFYL